MNQDRLEKLRKIYAEYPRRQLAEQLLLDFKEYVKWIHFTINGTEYDMEHVHEVICDALQRYTEQKNTKRNLMINCPPGTGKSLLLQYWITWNFARNKQCMFCYVAYGDRLIKKLSRESRNLMMIPEWEELFGKEMDPGDKSVLNYHLLSGGSRSGLTAGTIQSGLLGLDAGNPASKIPFSGALLLDDINSPEVISSLNEQTETPEIYNRKLTTRRRTPRTPTICIMQRHHKNDFAGWVLEHEPDEWEWIIIPAINDDGTSFYEKRYPIEDLRRIERGQPYMFASMYQQDPLAAQGALFKHEWMRYYDIAPEKMKKTFITTDTAFTTTGDYTVFCCWGLGEDNNLYLLRMRRGRWESYEVKKFLLEFFGQCNTAYKKCRRVYIENTLSGISLIQELKREEPKMAVVEVKRGAKKSKRVRIEDSAIWCEAGRVWFKKTDPYLAEVYAEMINYNPNEKNPRDDILDNLADACQIAFSGSTSSIFI